MRQFLRTLFAALPTNPELLVAQAGAFTRQVPLLYVLVLVNMTALAITHLPTAPVELTIIGPAFFTVVSIGRLVVWWRRRKLTITPLAAARMLRTTTLIATGLGLLFVAWSMCLFPYGGYYEHAQITFFIAVTTIGCMFCLMHFRPAALALVASVLLPAAFFLATRESGVLVAIALNLLLSLVVLVIVLFKNTRDFEDLVASRQVLARREAEAVAQARLDTLTGLPNRLGFLEFLERTARRSEALNGRFFVAIADLDGFKGINDVYGHAVGDRVLRDAGKRLTGALGPEALVARLGGDEYGIVIPNDCSGVELNRLTMALNGCLKEPFAYDDATAFLSASIGFAQSRAGDTLDQLQDRADYAAYQAKETNPGSVVLFSEHHEEQIRQQRVLEQALRRADFESEIRIVLQPIVNTLRGDTVGYEVLSRWRSPEFGEVSPALFIPIAERLGLVAEIDLIAVKRALAAIEQLPPSIRLSVNLSASEVGADAAIQRLSALLSTSRPASRRIDFEITETAVMRDADRAAESLLRLVAHGARISLDDFGTGHSSLGYVHRLPIHRIKIDRSFVADLGENDTSLAIVKTTLDLCRNLGIECVVEGVETADQAGALAVLGAHLQQGYFFGRPMEVPDVLNAASMPQMLADVGAAS